MRTMRGSLAAVFAVATVVAVPGAGQAQASSELRVVAGPIDARLPRAGNAIRKDFSEALSSVLPWAVKGWIRSDDEARGASDVFAIVDKSDGVVVKVAIESGRLRATAGQQQVRCPNAVPTGSWALVSLRSTPTGITLTCDGQAAGPQITLTGTPAALVLAPRYSGGVPFTGAVSKLTVWQGPSDDPRGFVWGKPNQDLIQFEDGSPTWPLQTKQYTGLDQPQDPATLPASRSAAPVRKSAPQPDQSKSLTESASGGWKIGAWRFAAQPQVSASPEAISSPRFDTSSWLPATVPGTVLTSYIDNGVYPDPSYGLDNLAIPEFLSRQDYWFRTEFVVPETAGRESLALDFLGINYAAEVWVNGKRLGAVKGAFIRGRFQLDSGLRPGQQVVVAVRISPPPHPGRAQEESLLAGPGKNGGAMAIDGPTFAASEGWDWIPTVRDRETGIWQDVLLEATGPVRLGDPHVQTVLPKTDNSIADITFTVPVANQSDASRDVTVEAKFDGIVLTRTVSLAPHSAQLMRFSPNDFPQLHVANPELWWPNGYGKPVLHNLALTAQEEGRVSDARSIRFGIREISYELSAVNPAGALQRVSVAPDRSGGEQLLDVRHEGIREVDGDWVVSLARGIAGSPAMSVAAPSTLAPHLLIRVNGLPIAVRGGNWGMDDWRKRVSRERMEPYFRLHREANVNTIRNWLGQSTEQVFFDLADEYGLLVLNDFWISTQDHNAEPGDSELFLANAADTIDRFQYHPSIALWIGRNEGVPPPVLNTGLDKLVRENDGTRLYLPNSRSILMANSGPWKYQPSQAYFTKLARGFSTEVGTPSFPTLETFKAMMPAEDQWPVSDTWAYHDWHQGQAGDVHAFMQEVTARFGAPANLTEFEKQAQVLEYESHRAIFEGMNAGLFVRNSGRLLWMTHPAWPSTMWQIYSHNYDTQASYFGFKKGAEPVHIQLNLPGWDIAVVNSLARPLRHARVRIGTYDLNGGLLSDQQKLVDASSFATSMTGISIDPKLFEHSPVLLIKLQLYDAQGQLLGDNFYWLAREASAYSAMARMKSARVAIQPRRKVGEGDTEIHATIRNESAWPALMVRLSALDGSGARVLPAYWSDNYVSLLPGETREVTLSSPKTGTTPAAISVDGWNVEQTESAIVQ